MGRSDAFHAFTCSKYQGSKYQSGEGDRFLCPPSTQLTLMYTVVILLVVVMSFCFDD